ncbi:hypothetical protein AArcSl_3123 [Halalkaliarchaeum desulfuricum]|uniref:Uncharacterized protein n=1 Tax=Halalkaliarchaeum desulfuricum TaxID=2055893 RepID=A0A343TNQ8_9EURY|nr:hypothetical protein [Halalkaliarchaeum desulfuricum]AUX10730.1 hypothetical protein AArcSl_3123 [Halalkaliarchaeum desulfuricum]
MSKHFEDARYYLGRAVEHAKAGMKEELEDLEVKVRELTGREADEEPEPSRLESLQDDLKELEERAEGEAKEAIESARAKIQAFRDEEPEESGTPGESEQAE